MSVTLAIIGTAGRGGDAVRLARTPQFFFEKMLAASKAVAELVGATTIVSGGAPWGDAAAVRFFIETSPRYKLVLYLPALLIPVKGRPDWRQFATTAGGDSQSNPGGTLNGHHDRFLAAMAAARPEFSSYADLAEAVGCSRAEINVCPGGIFERNRAIAARANHVLAMTFGSGRVTKPGGTAFTLQHFLAKGAHGQAFHLDLNSMRLFRNAQTLARSQSLVRSPRR